MISTIGKYRIQCELGRGGFGVVYRAIDPAIGREVAVKLLLSEQDAAMMQRFRREAMAIARMHHRNVVTLHDFGDHEGAPYIVMELLDGQDLRSAIRETEKLSILQKASILSQIAAGLGHAHRQGILHRDVKPANIMLLKDGTVKLMDFGISRLSNEGSLGLTPTGGVIGTFRYLAPEQFRGRQQDERSEIFSFGLVAYELVCGKHPFDAPDPAAVMYQITESDPPEIRTVLPNCPEPLEILIRTTLHKEPESRYQTFDDLLMDLLPIEIGLKREAAAALTAAACEEQRRNKLDVASALAREAVELDPSYPDARQLYEALQKELRRRSVRPRVEDLQHSANAAIAQGRYSEAIRDLERALDLDPSDADLRMQIERVRKDYERAAFARKQIDAARKALEAGHLASAELAIRQAIEADPNNPDAHRLQNDLEAEIQRAGRHAKMQEMIERARDFARPGELESARSVLVHLKGDYPECVEADEMLATIVSRLEARARCKKTLDHARSLIASGAYTEAESALHCIESSDEDDAEVQELLRLATDGRLRTETIAASIANSKKLRSENNFSEALNTLAEMLSLYPHDATLRAFLDDTQRMSRVFEQAQTETQTKAITLRCETLRGLGLFEEALSIVERALEEYPRSEELSALRLQIEDELSRFSLLQAEPSHETIPAEPITDRQTPLALPRTDEPRQSSRAQSKKRWRTQLPKVKPSLLLIGFGLLLAGTVSIAVLIRPRTPQRPKPFLAAQRSVPGQVTPAHEIGRQKTSSDTPLEALPSKKDFSAKPAVILPAPKAPAANSSGPSPLDRPRTVEEPVPQQAVPVQSKQGPVSESGQDTQLTSAPASSAGKIEGAKSSPVGNILTSEAAAKAKITPSQTPTTPPGGAAAAGAAALPNPVSPIYKSEQANARGVSLFNLHMYKEAIVNFDEAIRLRPENAAAYHNRGSAYHALGKYREAIEDYDRSLRLRPGDEPTLSLKKDAEQKLAAGVVAPGKDITPPQILKAFTAKYTKEAIRAGVDKGVLLQMTIDAQGNAEDFKVLDSPGFGLDAEAINAAKKAHLKPAMKDGSPVPYVIQMEVKFSRR